MSEQDWAPKVGDAVAVVTSDRGKFTSFQRREVVRVGKRDVVLDDEQRFSIARRLEKRPGGTWDMRTVKVVATDDPIAHKAAAEIRTRNAWFRARRIADEFSRNRPESPSPAEVILALAPLTGVQDEIQALFTPDATTDERLGDDVREAR